MVASDVLCSIIGSEGISSRIRPSRLLRITESGKIAIKDH